MPPLKPCRTYACLSFALPGNDAHDLARVPNDASALTSNVLADEGGDIREIADTLKGMETCVACSHEGMGKYCVCIVAKQLGRRLARLIDRADARAPR